MTIQIRKLEYLGHIIRNNQRYGLLKLILQGKVEVERRRISWLKRNWFGITTNELFRYLNNQTKHDLNLNHFHHLVFHHIFSSSSSSINYYAFI